MSYVSVSQRGRDAVAAELVCVSLNDAARYPVNSVAEATVVRGQSQSV